MVELFMKNGCWNFISPLFNNAFHSFRCWFIILVCSPFGRPSNLVLWSIAAANHPLTCAIFLRAFLPSSSALQQQASSLAGQLHFLTKTQQSVPPGLVLFAFNPPPTTMHCLHQSTLSGSRFNDPVLLYCVLGSKSILYSIRDQEELYRWLQANVDYN